MKPISINEVLVSIYHSVPPETWRPHDYDDTDYDDHMAWLDHLYSSEAQFDEIEAVWVDRGTWPEMEERTRYFIRLRIAEAYRFVVSVAESEKYDGSFFSVSGGSAERRRILSVISQYWDRRMSEMWARECAKYRTPRPIHMPKPK